VSFLGKILVLWNERVPFLGKILVLCSNFSFGPFLGQFLSDTDRGAFLGGSKNNRGTNIENCTLLQKWHFPPEKGHFRPKGGVHLLQHPRIRPCALIENNSN
jgi:hypothetical protein